MLTGALLLQGPALTNAHIVPDVVDHVDLDDAVSMRVQYGDRLVTTGNELRPSEVGFPGLAQRTMTTAGRLPCLGDDEACFAGHLPC